MQDAIAPYHIIPLVSPDRKVHNLPIGGGVIPPHLTVTDRPRTIDLSSSYASAGWRRLEDLYREEGNSDGWAAYERYLEAWRDGKTLSAFPPHLLPALLGGRPAWCNNVPEAEYLRTSDAVAWVAPVIGAASYMWAGGDGKHVTQPVVVGVKTFVSDALTPGPDAAAVRAAIVARLVDDLRQRMNRDLLAPLTFAPNVSNYAGSNLTLDRFEAGLAAYLAQMPNGPRHAFAGSCNQVRDLRKAIRASGNGGLVYGAPPPAPGTLPSREFVGTWCGVEVYQSPVPAPDAENDTGGFVSCAVANKWTGGTDFASGAHLQTGGGLGMAIWPLRGRFGISIEAERCEERKGYLVVALAMYGTAITASHLVRAFITRRQSA